MNGGRFTPRWRYWAAAATILFFLCLVGRFWHPVYGFTPFLQLSSGADHPPLPVLRDLPVFMYPDNSRYDGAFYAQIAYDPTLRMPELREAVDSLSYRARRILPPALAWLLAFGQPDWIVHVYSVLNVACWLILAALAWRLLPVTDFRSWLAWAGLLFSAGALHCVRLSLTDLIATTLIAAAFLARERGRQLSATCSLAAAALSKETSVLAFGALVRGPWNSRHAWLRNFLTMGIAATPLFAWMLYVRCITGSAESGSSNFAAPLSGLFTKWCDAFAGLTRERDTLLAWSTVLAVVGVSTQCIWILLRPRMRDAWWWLALPYVVLACFLDVIVWEGHPGAFTRVLLPLQLAFNVLAVRHRAALAVILAGNLSILSGLVAFKSTTIDLKELGHGHTSTHVIVARCANGWFPVETGRWQTRTWSSGEAQIVFEQWPHSGESDVQVDFEIRAHSPRHLQIRQHGRVLWQGPLSSERQTVSLNHVRLTGAFTALEFSTDQPATPESGAPGARQLSFALYNLQISPAR